MEFTNEDLNLENGLKKEWLITNGIGGYSSSSILGANTRKYHGLLVAPLTPPARRHVILSKLDESIILDDKKYDLFTNVCLDYISHGYRYQVSFKKDYVPIFSYKVEDTTVTKIVCMKYGKNTVGVYYKIRNGSKKAKLQIAPIVNFRDFHCMNKNENISLRQEIKNRKVKLIVDDNSAHPIYMNLSDGTYIKHEDDMFLNMFYVEEEKRGFDPIENHGVSGIYEVEIEPNEEKEISFVCSFEDNIEMLNVKHMINEEIIRVNMLYNNTLLIDNKKVNKTKLEHTSDQLIKDFILATDNFVVYRPTFKLHTIIAGYPWFLDWGRDTLISFEGLLLITKRYDIAKEVLLTMVRDIKYGLVPNGYSGFDNRPLYNSVDSSLLLFEQIKKYLTYTGDYNFVKEHLYYKLEEIIENYCKGIDVDNNNIYLDSDYLIVSGTRDTQNTWMDAKYNDIAVTPRNGKAVEINSMWYNSLNIMAELAIKFGEKSKAKKYKELAQNCQISFNNKFYNARRKCLYDVLGDSKIRPNQLFALSLSYPIIDPTSDVANNIINVVEKKLLNAYGLKTLAKGEEGYVEVYEGDVKKRDTSYHQGITWPWLLGLYYNSLKNMAIFQKSKKDMNLIDDKIEDFRKKVIKTFSQELNENGCIGSIAEIYDSAKPQLPKGTIAQSWSVAEIFRIILGR